MTLPEFLLARIAEDVADWRAVEAREVVQMLHGRPLAPRMLAECEAKRRIVMETQRELAADIAGNRATDLMWRTLEHLALPYADHPDYRQEWRP